MENKQISKILYNHYGEEHSLKFPQAKNTFSNQLKQIKAEYERNIQRAKDQKRIDRDLFLRAKHKINRNKKRSLKSLKVEKLNQIRVIKNTLKSLHKLSLYKGLLKFEIKKINKKIKDNAEYLKTFYRWSKNSAENYDSKKKKLEAVKLTCSNSEQEYFIYKNTLLYLLHQISKFKIDEDQYDDFYQKNKLLVEEVKQKILSSNKVTVTQHELNKKQSEKNILEIKKQYNYKKTKLILQLNAEINEAEHKYNDSYKKILEKENDQKIKYLETLNETKNNYNDVDQKIKQSKNNFINSQKKLIQSIKFNKKYNSMINYYSYLFENNKARAKAIKIKVNDQEFTETKKQALELLKKINTTDKDNLIQIKSFIKKLNLINKSIEKNINVHAKTKQQKIIISYHFGVLGYLENKYLLRRKSLAEFDLKIAKEMQEYDYEGDYKQKTSQAYLEYIEDWKKELDSLNEVRINSLIKLNNNDFSSIINKQDFKNIKKEIKEKWDKQLKQIKISVKNNDTTKKALRQKKQEFRIYKKEEIRELKFQDDSKQVKRNISTFKFRYIGKKKIWKKVYGSKIVESRKSTPIKSFNQLRLVSALINLIIPGSAEILFFKQYKKGVLMATLTILLYVLFIPFITGTYSFKFGGLLGIIDLGKSKHDWINGIMPDSRWYLLGAVLSIFFIIALTIYNLSSSITAYKIGKIMEHGVRPMGWFHTKRWISNQGFPWLISLPGWMLIIFVVVTPVVVSFLMSFTNMGFMHEAPGATADWVGFEQYGKWWLFKDSGMAKSLFRVLQWTLLWTFFSSGLVIILGVVVAVIVNQNRVKFKKFWRLIYILPWAIPAFVTIMFMKSAFQSDADSLMNNILITTNLIDKPKDWFGSIWTVRIILILLQGWLGHSYIFLLITGNIQKIPKDIYEASQIDGAKNNQMFRHMTLPIVLSSIAPLLISQFTFNFNNFIIISLFSGGGPAFEDPTPFLEGGTDILISWIYKLTSQVAQIEGNMAFAAAMTMLAALISVGFASYGFSKSSAFRRY